MAATTKKGSFFKTFAVQEATRVQKKVKALISGPSNAGKTLGSLLIAKGLTNSGKVLMVDSERGRSSLHVRDENLGDWSWDAAYMAPEDFSPDTLISAINEAKAYDYQAIIIDSFSHEWDYIKNWQVELGGRYTDWKIPKAEHAKFVRAMIGADIHIIMTLRSKMEYVQSYNDKNKAKVEKLGLSPQGDQNFLYEVDFHFAINENHIATMDKTAQGLFSDPSQFKITEDVGHQLRAFAEEGEDPETRTKKKYISKIRTILSDYMSLEDREIPDIPGTDFSYESLLSMSLSELETVGKQLKEGLQNAS
jgi:hypothetical protein